MEQRFKKIALDYEIVLVAVLILLSGLFHGINMFQYPYYENDEGTYLSRAWSLINFGKLSPETYRYDHAPLGWILLALWTALTGGFFTFGFSINSGRVLMFLLHLISSLFLYLIARKLIKDPIFAAIPVLFFSLSPLAVYFQRRILLDNIMVFWVLLALVLLLYLASKVKMLILSGLALGLAIISKENAIFFIPGFLYVIFLYVQKNRLLSLLKFLAALAVPVLSYFLYAVFRGEFFPYGFPLAGEYPHASLIGTSIEQLQRGGGNIFDLNSLFWESFKAWFVIDPIIISLGFASILINCFFGIRNVPDRIAAVFSLLFISFLIRGGVILEFYILPALPFFALNIAVSFWRVHMIVREYRTVFWVMSITVMLGMAVIARFFSGNYSKGYYNLFVSDQTFPQVAAVAWILAQNKPQAFYAIDNYAYVELHARQNGNFKFAEYYWRVDTDSEVSKRILNKDWQNIDYIVMTPQMEKDITSRSLFLTFTAWTNSKLIGSFYNDGWGISIWEVEK